MDGCFFPLFISHLRDRVSWRRLVMIGMDVWGFVDDDLRAWVVATCLVRVV